MQVRRLRSIDCWNEWWWRNSTHNSWALFEMERIFFHPTCVRLQHTSQHVPGKIFFGQKQHSLKFCSEGQEITQHPFNEFACACGAAKHLFFTWAKETCKGEVPRSPTAGFGLVFTVHILHLIIAIKASLENAHALPRRQHAKLKGAPRLKSCRKGHSGQIRGFAPI